MNSHIAQPKRKVYKYCSLGLGQQSTLFALWVATKDPRFKDYWDAELIFADTKEEEEGTYDFLYNHLIDFMSDKNGEIKILERPYSLLEYFEEKKEVPLGWVNPKCSSHFKRDLINEYLREKLGKNGRIYSKDTKVIEVLGIGPDEPGRLKPPRESWKVRHYPLAGIGITSDGETFDLNLDLPEMPRYRCVQEYKNFGLPTPPKSGCKCCPNKGEKQFIKLRKEDPEYFQRLMDMEENAKEKNVTFLIDTPLEFLDRQTSLDDFNFGSQQCDGGYCFT